MVIFEENFKMKKIILLLILASSFNGFSQVIMSGSGSYSQNFDALLNTGSVNNWIDNSTIPSVFSQRTSTSTTYAAGTGTLTTGGLYSFGATGSTERALGTVGSSNLTSGGNFAHGILLQNTSGFDINSLNITYTLEQWRNGGNTTPNVVTFWYRVSTTSITNLISPAPNFNLGWTAVTVLNAASPINTATSGALDGNNTLNRVTLSNVAIPNLVIPDGSFIMLRWYDPDHTGSDHGLAIDDVSLNWTVCTSPVNYYLDSDGDLFGDNSTAQTLCQNPGLGYVTVGGDCNDTNPLINPNATEVCDGIDNDCNGIADDGLVFAMYYVDADGDGFGEEATGVESCSQPLNTITTGGDCDDTNDQIYPGATEVCDAVDNDCDGSVDEGLNFTTYYTDADNDGFGTGSTGLSFCSNPGPDFSTNNQDCDDSNGEINPNATDILDNGIDENCDGVDGILGISNELFVNFEFIPNPVSDVVKVLFSTQALSGNLAIQDMNGKTLITEKTNGQTTFYINVNHLAPGIYLVIFNSSKGSITKRLVKN